MLTRIRVKNFKKLENADIELGRAVVFVGPNNSGKTTALQALALWDIGVRQWNARYKNKGKTAPETRPGVTINRNDLISIPIPDVNLLWRDLHVRNITNRGKEQKTQSIRIDVIVDGVTEGKPWSCGFEFDYANPQSFYCRPLRLSEGAKPQRMPVCDQADGIRVAFLPPMSGLADREFLKQAAQVLRNLCYQIFTKSEQKSEWRELVDHVQRLFGVILLDPTLITERSEITMLYEDQHKNRLDLSASGRGLQQTLLLLVHLYANPKTVLLLDEPDAHLEILRQRQIYQLITDLADRQASQVICASHSEVVLNEAGTRGTVIAFVGSPHKISDRGSQVVKSLTDIGWESYFNAELKGWVLYLEDATDYAILRVMAEKLGHPAQRVLDTPFVHYVSTNLPSRARDHFFGLREAKSDLVGLALFDRIDKELQVDTPLRETMWRRREIENYFTSREVLLAYARGKSDKDLFAQAEAAHRENAMKDAIDAVTAALATLNKPSPWSFDIKATDDFLDPLFKNFFGALKLPLLFRKADYYQLAREMPADQMDPEVTEKLDMIVSIAALAKPKTS
jgi:energy-coupling factor transporter ATP-binding protein EcfA2